MICLAEHGKRLKKERGFAYAWISANERHTAENRPAAKNTVKLCDPRGKPSRVFFVDLIDRKSGIPFLLSRLSLGCESGARCGSPPLFD